MFAVSGDITKEEAVKKFNRYFGDWKATDYPHRCLTCHLKNQMPVFITLIKKSLNPQLSAASLPRVKMILIFMLSPFLILLSAAAVSLPEFSALCVIMKGWLTAPAVFIAQSPPTESLALMPLRKHPQL